VRAPVDCARAAPPIQAIPFRLGSG
jgi:hypothetical protein